MLWLTLEVHRYSKRNDGENRKICYKVFVLAKLRVGGHSLINQQDNTLISNDILRRVRYTFDYSDLKMIEIFALADLKVTREEVSNWLKRDDDPAFVSCSDLELATFLNGMISDRRGKKEGAQPVPEEKLTNNIIFKKLKIALNLQTDGILEIMGLADLRVSKHELTAFFRRPDQKNYRVCKDQILRNFLKGLQFKYRDRTGEEPEKSP